MVPGYYVLSRNVYQYMPEMWTLRGTSKGNSSWGTENGPLKLCSGGVWDRLSSGKHQGTNQLQLTPAPDYERKKEIFYAQIRRILPGCNVRRIWALKISCFIPRPRGIAHPGSGPALDLLRICSGLLTFAHSGYHFLQAIPQHAELL